MSERLERWLDEVAKPWGINGGSNLRVFWNAVPHRVDDDHPDDKDWAASEPDPDAP